MLPDGGRASIGGSDSHERGHLAQLLAHDKLVRDARRHTEAVARIVIGQLLRSSDSFGLGARKVSEMWVDGNTPKTKNKNKKVRKKEKTSDTHTSTTDEKH